MLDIPEQLVLAVLKALDLLFGAVVTLATTIADNIVDVLGASIDLGPVNTIYAWIQTSNGITNPEPMTIGGLLFLIAGFVVTTLYKLVNGVDQAPFPGGKFPAITPPPWHSAHSPVGIGSTDDSPSDPTTNQAMLALQTVAGFGGVIGGLVELAADLAPALQAEYGGTLDTILAILSTGFSAVCFTLIPACPPVTGTEWTGADGAWSGGFAVAILYTLLCVGALGTKLAGGSDVAVLKNFSLKNVPEVVFGPVVATVFGGALMTCFGVGFALEPSNPYTTAMTVIPPIPG
ncbi:hypothetical protein, partial [Frankia sp. Cr1]|uniref:hypothetical protein n=1 Tax=Frankia sp. Cr1 TaxID=3073931 RepID=UPI002AD30766